VKSLIEVLTAISVDIEMVCNTSLVRDLKTLRSRTEHEGESFLTITLPAFSKAFFFAMEKGQWTPDLCSAFGRKTGGSLPKFLWGLTSLVFTPQGVLREQPSVGAVDAIRQICLFASKIQQGCSATREKKALADFVLVDREISHFRPLHWRQKTLFSSVVSVLYGTILADVDKRLLSEDFMPKHGPGATATRISGNRKFRYQSWTRRLQRCLPIDLWQFVNHNELAEFIRADYSSLGELFLEKETPSRVITVPKTAKTPRVIAIEPVHMQYVQQGLSSLLVRAIEQSPLVGGKINFSDQTINGRHALSSSLDKKLSTLDLSEASDRVHAWFAFELFRRNPLLLRSVFSSRSKQASVLDQTVCLKKFASMGSALCFPVEAMVFYALAVTAVMSARNCRITSRNIIDASNGIYVYGDDIITPTLEVKAVTSTLESAGLKVNKMKSFSSSNFRESCGVDAFMGVNVTPVKMRRLPPKSHRDAEEVLSWISMANLFYNKGYWTTARVVRRIVEDVVGNVPHVKSTSPVAGWISFLGSYCVERYNRTLHRFEVRGIVAKGLERDDPIDGYRALHRYFTERGKQPQPVDSSMKSEFFVNTFTSRGTSPLRSGWLTKSARRGSVCTKIRWASPF